MYSIYNGRIVTPNAVLDDQALLYDTCIEGIVRASEIPMDSIRIDAQGGYVLPGLIDLHIHGYMGDDASEGDFEGLRRMAQGLARNGVTAFLPTTMTLPLEQLDRVFVEIRRGMRESLQDDWMGAEIIGCNAEGPFLNPNRSGAQDATHIRPGDATFLKKYADVIRMCTIAPEIPGNLECIRELARDTDLLISMGHTQATYEQACAAIDAGARHVTHLFNAMEPLGHRQPGLVGAALSDERVRCELIADTFHVHKSLFPMLASVKGDNLVLVTDCTSAGGLGDGVYMLGGQSIYVEGIRCLLADGTIAGSVLRLNQAIANMFAHARLPLQIVVRMASLTPARCIGLDARKGSLEVGKDADIAIFDTQFQPLQTILRGRTIFKAEKHLPAGECSPSIIQ